MLLTAVELSPDRPDGIGDVMTINLVGSFRIKDGAFTHSVTHHGIRTDLARYDITVIQWGQEEPVFLLGHHHKRIIEYLFMGEEYLNIDLQSVNQNKEIPSEDDPPF
jgi:hypothetical protein